MNTIQNTTPIHSVTLIGGTDKSGYKEEIKLTFEVGSMTALVGPTGSGKSCLLADIEWLAREDTPTGRTILIDGQIPGAEYCYPVYNPVAQLSQNMHFVIDTTVGDFICLHAKSQGKGKDPEELTRQIIEQANQLTGEPFNSYTPLASLSGGQSRALMIADTAFLSVSPVILIDEIENAGIDRIQALKLLIRKDKIVFIATHDPLLALMADRRLIIRNGAIAQIIETTEEEKRMVRELEKINDRMRIIRQQLHAGEHIMCTSF